MNAVNEETSKTDTCCVAASGYVAKCENLRSIWRENGVFDFTFDGRDRLAVSFCGVRDIFYSLKTFNNDFFSDLLNVEVCT